MKGMADVKELIPEFYMDSTDFLLNRNNLDLGTTQSGQRVRRGRGVVKLNCQYLPYSSIDIV